MCPSCFSLMFRNSDVIRKFLFPCRICFLLGFIKKIQLTIDIFPFFTGSTKKFLREIFNLLMKVFFSSRSASNVFCKDWISSVCVEMVLFSWLIMSLYASIFESFELPAICFLLLFYCSYYTIKSNEKEAENPVFTRDCRHDTGCGKLSIFVGWHRGFTRSLRRFECFWLFDFKTGHEPVELLPGQLLYFQLISGPAESALDFHTFIQKALSKNSNNSFY